MKKLTREELFEMQDYIDKLSYQTNLDPDTYEDINKAIQKELDSIKDEDNLIEHFNGLGE